MLQRHNQIGTFILTVCVLSATTIWARSATGDIRTWTDVNGKTIEAQYQDSNETHVQLKKADGASLMVLKSMLSSRDIDYLEYEAPIPLDKQLCGEWIGWKTHNGGIGQVALTIRKAGTRLEVEFLGYDRLTEEEAKKAGKSKPRFDGQSKWSGAYVENYILDLSDGTNLLFKPKPLAKGKMLYANYERDVWSWALNDWKATYVKPGVIWKTITNEKENLPQYYRFIKKSLLDRPLPLNLEKGRVHQMKTLEPSVNTYTLYIPQSYNHSKAAPLLVNFSPSGNAKPLHTQMAEELGWVMIGLGQSKNGIKSIIARNNLHTAIFDCMRRLRIDRDRLYFSGFSGGARSASITAGMFRNNVAGVICIGAGFYLQENYPPTYMPVCFIVGKTDVNHKEVAIDLYPSEKKKGRPCELIIHPGGHSWGRPEDHEAAIRWLDAQWKKNGKPHP